MHKAFEFNCDFYKTAGQQSPMRTQSSKPCTLYKETQRRRKHTRRERGDRTRREGKIRAKHRERKGETEKKKAEQKKSGEPNKGGAPILTFFSFLQLPLSFCITSPEARKQHRLPSRDDPARQSLKLGEATSPLVTANI